MSSTVPSPAAVIVNINNTGYHTKTHSQPRGRFTRLPSVSKP